jgi:hypothetical protein
MIAEKEIKTNATALVAASLWITSLAAWGVSWAVDVFYVSILALLICGAAVTATIRSYFIAQTEQLRNALIVTGRSSEGDVRPLR